MGSGGQESGDLCVVVVPDDPPGLVKIETLPTAMGRKVRRKLNIKHVKRSTSQPRRSHAEETRLKQREGQRVVVGHRIAKEVERIDGAPATIRSETSKTPSVLRLLDTHLPGVAAFNSDSAVFEHARVCIVRQIQEPRSPFARLDVECARKAKTPTRSLRPRQKSRQASGNQPNSAKGAPGVHAPVVVARPFQYVGGGGRPGRISWSPGRDSRGGSSVFSLQSHPLPESP